MGYGDLAVQMIIFISVVSLATTVVIFMKGQVDTTVSSLSKQQGRISLSLDTEINIETIKHNATYDQTTIYIRNTGNSKLDIDKVDVFTNSLRIPRLDSNRSIQVLSDTDSINIGTWDPGETVLIKVNQSLSSLSTHTITVSASYGITDEKDFSF